MKKLIVLSIILGGICSVQAENFFQTSNPFPQTSPQTMNNIYESEPATLQDEAKKAKKSFFRRGKNIQQKEATLKNKVPVYPVQSDTVQEDGSFYMFTTGQ